MVLFPVQQNPRWWLAAILKNSMAISRKVDHPIYSMFGPRMGFSGSADRMALFPV